MVTHASGSTGLQLMIASRRSLRLTSLTLNGVLREEARKQAPDSVHAPDPQGGRGRLATPAAGQYKATCAP